MAAHDLLGKRGESIVVARLMDFCGNPEPYFDPHLLGDKCPTFDYLVELVNAGDMVPYFFVQVKTTRRGFTRKDRRLIVQVNQDDIRRMVRCPIPTYLVGVDEPRGEAYVVSIRGGMTGPIGSIPSTYPLSCANLRTLWDEVKDCWQEFTPSAQASAFPFEG